MIKFIGLGKGIKKVKNPVDLGAAERIITNQTKDKFEEYRKARIMAAVEAKRRWLD